MKFLFTCGGTAGHIYPAVGIAGRLRQLMPDCEILFIGAKGMMECELVPREGYEIKTVPITNLRHNFTPEGIVHNIKTVKNVIVSTQQAAQIIRDFAPDAVIGTGGYVCYPVLKAAHKQGIPTLVHESNAVPGVTTKMVSSFVDCVMVGFEGAKANYKSKVNVVYTGTPVRTEFRDVDKAAAKKKLGIPADRPLVLSVWGSLGSEYMNNAIVEFITLAQRDRRFEFIHSAGKRRYDPLRKALDKACPNCMDYGFDVRPYIYSMPTVMAAADLIMCRSGASTLAELEALGKPAVLVPSPNVTGHHQEKNARALESVGAAKVFLEGEFTVEQLYDEISALLTDGMALENMAKAMKGAGLENSTEMIADLVLKYAKK